MITFRKLCFFTALYVSAMCLGALIFATWIIRSENRRYEDNSLWNIGTNAPEFSLAKTVSLLAACLRDGDLESVWNLATEELQGRVDKRIFLSTFEKHGKFIHFTSSGGNAVPERSASIYYAAKTQDGSSWSGRIEFVYDNNQWLLNTFPFE